MPVQRFSPDAPQEYAGCVLGEREHNGYDDSDFFARVWDEAQGAVVEVRYHTTRCASGGRVEIDATAAVRAKARAWESACAERAAAERARLLQALPACGDQVQVELSRGARRHLHGKTGTVCWQGPSKLARGDQRAVDWRVAVEIDGERIYLSESNVRRAGATITARAAREALAARGWAPRAA